MTDFTSYQFLKKLKALPYVARIYLFGSRARGDNQPRSDIDLAISCPQASRTEWHQLLDIIHTADTLLEIDCVRLDTEKDVRLINNILNEGKILYERT